MVLTDWLSITPAEGLASRPSRSRAICRRKKLMFSHRPCLPRVKVVLHRRPLRKIARQQTPRTRRSQNIQQSLHNPPQLYFSRSPQHFLDRHVGRNQGPFRIRHITCVTQIFAPILTASGFSPHVVAPMLHDTARISQLTEITQFIFGQPLSGGRNRRGPARGGLLTFAGIHKSVGVAPKPVVRVRGWSGCGIQHHVCRR